MVKNSDSYFFCVEFRMYISAGRTILSDGAPGSSILAINRRTASSAILFIGRSTEVIAGDTRAAILVPDIHAIEMVSGIAMPLFSNTFFAPTACRSEKQKSASGISRGGSYLYSFSLLQHRLPL